MKTTGKIRTQVAGISSRRPTENGSPQTFQKSNRSERTPLRKLIKGRVTGRKAPIRRKKRMKHPKGEIYLE